jgi:nicotinate-nucleotide pyrophosphorylase (carboxylating)
MRWKAFYYFLFTIYTILILEHNLLVASVLRRYYNQLNFMRHVIFKKIVQAALREDIGTGDVTTRLTISPKRMSEANIFYKQRAVVCGLELARMVFQSLDPGITFSAHVREGELVRPGQRIVHLRGKSRAILTGERVALNFLSYLSAIATHTRDFCEAIKPSRAIILDTRKTTPTLRVLERYAVCVGGGKNHRFDLGEMALLKDNHRVLAARPGDLARVVRELHNKTHKPVEIEVDTLEEFKEVLAASPEMVLLDNMSVAEMRRAVKIVRSLPRGRRPLLEASGGVTLKRVKAIAQTGVDRISIGALTHSRSSIDVSLEITA